MLNVSTHLLEPRLGVEPRHLATFAAVAETGSFRGAATRLGYVQSAVSQQIAQLERVLDARLIERGQGNRGLTLTAAGEALLAHARRIVDQVRAVCADIGCLATGGLVRVAIEPAAASLLPGLTRRLTAAGLDARLAVDEAPAAAHPELVSSGTVDLALGSTLDPPATLSRHVMCLDRWVLVAQPGSTLAASEALGSWRPLRGERLIQDASHPPPLALDQLGAERLIGCDRLSVAFDLARAGVGAALVPALAVDPEDADLRTVELGKLLPPRTVTALWHPARRLPDITPVFASAREDGGHELLKAIG